MSAPRGFGRKVAHPPDLVFLFALFLRRVPHPFAICAKGWAARTSTQKAKRSRGSSEVPTIA